ncbi:CD20-like domain-containing protein [uncultured Streptococcus sp.]|uniref:CD20-like domain-containing protein n=1 Tax=uncultured Streptococcus sp. TaxID=83427 RepID=UPI0028D56CE7|nr:CD20-like domain-containing protein [uncultured Streptococcus sp.]
MKQERKVLGILAIIFGALALLGSWMPIINNFSFILAVLALIFGLIGLALNRKRPKTLAIVGTVLSVVSIAIVLATQAMYAKSLDKIGKDVEQAVSSASSSIESSQKEEDAKFNWTKEQFDALVTGDIANRGAGGSKYDDIVKEHGEPSDTNTSTVNDHENKTISYTSIGTKYKAVILSFAKQDDGTFLLITKVGNGLE